MEVVVEEDLKEKRSEEDFVHAFPVIRDSDNGPQRMAFEQSTRGNKITGHPKPCVEALQGSSHARCSVLEGRALLQSEPHVSSAQS